MPHFYAKSWKKDEPITLIVLAFYSPTARRAYAEQCPQEMENITAREAVRLEKDGCKRVLMLWDTGNTFKPAQ